MKRVLLLFAVVFTICTNVMSQDDYYVRLAKKYQIEAEYYQRTAKNYRIDSNFYMNRVRSVQMDAENYARNGNYEKARQCSKYVSELMEKYNRLQRYGMEADEKAAMYLEWAAQALAKR